MKEKLKREENKKKYKMGDKSKDMIKKGREALGRGDREKKQKKDKGQRKEQEEGKMA